jgi:hypothetical protein
MPFFGIVRKMKIRFSLLLILTTDLFAVEPVTPPEIVKSFILPGYFLIAMEKGDLNRDQLDDYILVLQKEGAESQDANRPLLILIQTPAKSFTLAKRNDKVVYCENCGGAMGDPFQQIEIQKNGFTVSHYGGSAWRWSVDYRFGYSRRDNTWQLVKVTKTNFHASSPEEPEVKVETPPRDYGKIAIDDFDPENYLGQSEK